MTANVPAAWRQAGVSTAVWTRAEVAVRHSSVGRDTPPLAPNRPLEVGFYTFSFSIFSITMSLLFYILLFNIL